MALRFREKDPIEERKAGRKRVFVGALIAAGLLLLFGLGVRLRRAEREEEWYEKSPVICHALGMTEDGDTLTNSREAFLYNYNAGQRIFETDVALTSDNVAVLRHEWMYGMGQEESFGWTEEEKRIPTAEEFLQAPIYGKYTPMSLLDLYREMQEKEDIYVVLDPKYSSDVRAQFTVLVNTALENGCEEVLDRVVVQLYYEQMYDEVESVYHFKNYLYTVYYIEWPGGEKAGSFCEEKGIPVLVLPYTWMYETVQKEEIEGYPVRLYVHTVDETEVARRMISLGVDGIYSDCITPEEMRQLLEE